MNNQKSMRAGRKGLAAFIMMTMLVLSFLLAACGGKKAGGEGAKEESVAGTYVGNFDMTELLNKEMEASGITLKSSVNTDFTLSLQEDEKFVFDIDAKTLVSSLTEAIQNEMDSIIAGLMGTEVTDETRDSIAQTAGYNTYDEFKEDITKQLTESMNEDTLKDLTDSCHIEGTYTVKDKDLSLSAEDTESFSVQVGKIQDDGSILLGMDANGDHVEITFVKQ